MRPLAQHIQTSLGRSIYLQIAIRAAAFSQRLADLMHEVVLSLGGRIGHGARRRLDRLLFELDRHGAFNRMRRR